MDAELLLVCLVVGGAGVGLWFAVRVPQFAPTSFRGFFIQLAVVWATLEASSRLLPVALGGGVPPLAALMLIAFPALVIAFALIAWTVMFMRDLIPR